MVSRTEYYLYVSTFLSAFDVTTAGGAFARDYVKELLGIA